MNYSRAYVHNRKLQPSPRKGQIWQKGSTRYYVRKRAHGMVYVINPYSGLDVKHHMDLRSNFVYVGESTVDYDLLYVTKEEMKNSASAKREQMARGSEATDGK